MRECRPTHAHMLFALNHPSFSLQGKTHTMEGHVSAGSVTEQSGVIPRSVHTIFDHLSEGKYEDYSVKVSMLELYNEELSDLLVEQEERAAGSTMGTIRKEKDSDSDVRKELRIFEDTTGKKGMIVQGLEEIPVTSSSEVFALLQKANKNRKVAETNLNARSSRSHYVFTIVVHTKEYNEDGEDIIKTGKLYLVDCQRHRDTCTHSQPRMVGPIDL